MTTCRSSAIPRLISHFPLFIVDWMMFSWWINPGLAADGGTDPLRALILKVTHLLSF